MVETQEKPVVGWFRLNRGRHSEGRNEDGSPKVYVRGDIIESTTDLEKHNTKGAPQKFTRVRPGTKPEQTPQETEREDFERMTVSQLKQLAADEEIDLGEAKTKQEIINALCR